MDVLVFFSRIPSHRARSGQTQALKGPRIVEEVESNSGESEKPSTSWTTWNWLNTGTFLLKMASPVFRKAPACFRGSTHGVPSCLGRWTDWRKLHTRRLCTYDRSNICARSPRTSEGLLFGFVDPWLDSLGFRPFLNVKRCWKWESLWTERRA